MKPDISEQIRAAIKADRQRIASAGGQGRAKALSAKRRREIATKASRAAARARTAAARAGPRNNDHGA
jgi:hypothetical protein